MVSSKSKITFSLKVESIKDTKTEPQTTEIVWPNLDYDQVLYVEKAFIGALAALNDGAAEIAAQATKR